MFGSRMGVSEMGRGGSRHEDRSVRSELTKRKDKRTRVESRGSGGDTSRIGRSTDNESKRGEKRWRWWWVRPPLGVMMRWSVNDEWTSGGDVEDVEDGGRHFTAQSGTAYCPLISVCNSCLYLALFVAHSQWYCVMGSVQTYTGIGYYDSYCKLSM